MNIQLVGENILIKKGNFEITIELNNDIPKINIQTITDKKQVIPAGGYPPGYSELNPVLEFASITPASITPESIIDSIKTVNSDTQDSSIHIFKPKLQNVLDDFIKKRKYDELDEIIIQKPKYKLIDSEQYINLIKYYIKMNEKHIDELIKYIKSGQNFKDIIINIILPIEMNDQLSYNKFNSYYTSLKFMHMMNGYIHTMFNSWKIIFIKYHHISKPQLSTDFGFRLIFSKYI